MGQSGNAVAITIFQSFTVTDYVDVDLGIISPTVFSYVAVPPVGSSAKTYSFYSFGQGLHGGQDLSGNPPFKFSAHAPGYMKHLAS